MKFEDLPDRAREDILDKHRYMNVQHDEWWDCVYTDFVEDMKTLGIRVDDMYFTGFSSQGDGACFEGCVEDWPKFLAHIDAPEYYRHEDIYEGLSFRVKHSGRYYHSSSISYSYDADWSNNHEVGSLRYYALEAILTECERGLKDLWEACEESFKEHMDDLYKNLEAEHEYLTSDECIIESLKDNDMMEELINDYLESTKESTEECMSAH